MKKLTHPALTIGLSLLLALSSAALTYSTPAQTLPGLSGTTLQVTPTPHVEDRSEVGSTDEIIIMGGVIALIILTPIFISRKSWR